MKKLMLICSVTFMFLLLGSSASAQNGPRNQAIQKIKTYLQELPSTKTATVREATIDGGIQAPSATVVGTVNRLEKRLFEELIQAVKTENSIDAAIDVVVTRYETPNVTKSSLVAFREKAQELLSN